MQIEQLYQTTIDNAPYPYQIQLCQDFLGTDVLEAPVGCGATLGIVLAWVYHRFFGDDQHETPNRLVITYPEYGANHTGLLSNIRLWCERIEADWSISIPVFSFYSTRWMQSPETPQILVGSQNLVLSRLLMRGYGEPKTLWSVSFGLLHNDALIVFKQASLMQWGSATSAQLYGLQQQFGTYRSKFLWILDQADSASRRALLSAPLFRATESLKVIGLSDQDYAFANLQHLSCPIQFQTSRHHVESRELYCPALANEIRGYHRPQTLTLVIVNQVKRAQHLYMELQDALPNVVILHGSYRGEDRKPIEQRIEDFQEAGGVIITTQTIEAEPRFSARLVVTELAPWASLIQRIQHCNGQQYPDAKVIWVDIRYGKTNLFYPYAAEDLIVSRQRLQSFDRASFRDLLQFSHPGFAEEGQFPTRHDLTQLFHTDTDLSGADLDISIYLSARPNEREAFVVWRELDNEAQPRDPRVPNLSEACRVNLFELRTFVRKHQIDVWKHDRQNGWVAIPNSTPITAGQMILLNCSGGGYRQDLGFTGDRTDVPMPVREPEGAIPVSYRRFGVASEVPKTWSVADYARTAYRQANRMLQLLNELELPDQDILEASQFLLAGRATPVFQQILDPTFDSAMQTEPWANREESIADLPSPEGRPGYCYEVVSLFMALHQNLAPLSLFLIAAHQGRVRMRIQPQDTDLQLMREAPDQDNPPRIYYGVYEEDTTLPLDLNDTHSIPSFAIKFDSVELGGAHSWTDMTETLLNQWGPFRLAYLEAISRAIYWNTCNP